MKIEINNVTLDTDTLTDEQREQIIAALAEKPKVFPQVGDKYEYLSGRDCCTATWLNDGIDLARLRCGNAHPVGRGQYLHRRRIAVKAMWEYVEREMPFVPDWENEYQSKCFPKYSHTKRAWFTGTTQTIQYQFELPHVSVGDFDRFLSENADSLAVIAEGADKWGM